MSTLLGSPSLDFMYMSASAPDAPPLSDTTIGCFIRLFFWIAACIMRAIWSEAPPAPAATTISTGLVGSQPATAGALTIMAANAAVAFRMCPTCFFPMSLFGLVKSGLAGCAIVRGKQRQFKPNRTGAAYDFRMRLQIASLCREQHPPTGFRHSQKKARAHREPALLLEIRRYRPLTRSADHAD